MEFDIDELGNECAIETKRHASTEFENGSADGNGMLRLSMEFDIVELLDERRRLNVELKRTSSNKV